MRFIKLHIIASHLPYESSPAVHHPLYTCLMHMVSTLTGSALLNVYSSTGFRQTCQLEVGQYPETQRSLVVEDEPSANCILKKKKKLNIPNKWIDIQKDRMIPTYSSRVKNSFSKS